MFGFMSILKHINFDSNIGIEAHYSNVFFNYNREWYFYYDTGNRQSQIRNIGNQPITNQEQLNQMFDLTLPGSCWLD